MLRLGTATPGELTRALERVERETARSGKTVRRIRDFFRSGASQFEPLDVESVVLDAVSTLRDRLEATGAAVSTNIASNLPRVFADRVQIGTVLHNLLANALDAATPATPATIAISAFVDGGNFVAIDVSDSGSGIAASIRESLFEPLSTTKPAGMGLGLAISRTIVQAHGGQLVLLDQDTTTFRATLPVHVATET
jgi:two-component system sensor kinase FixL